jgi:predicted metalloendopeptidase
MCPAFDWGAYLAARGLATLDSVNVAQPDFFRALDGMIATIPLDLWKSYLRWNVAREASPMMSAAFADEDFRFQQVLNGAEAPLPRWKRCLRWTDRDLGDLLGRAYVQKQFPPAARERALAMVHNLEAALGDRIQSLEWMGDATRARALEKLHAFEEKIGYPNTWRDYAGVAIARAGLLANHYACVQWETKRNVNKIGKPVDRGEWFMTAPTVNAFYSSSLNSINFPAGILQPPFFDPSWDDAVNYGSIGAVIGHEMTHGFDDRGRQFDAKGNLVDWWTPEDAARYKERSDKVADQFSSYTVLDTLHLNGRLTLGENTADLGGLAVAYHALQKALAQKPEGKIDGFTPEQRFFLSYARVWAAKIRPAQLRTMVQTNPHSPAMWRVNGPLSNLPEFREAFGCKDGDPMVRPATVQARIW